MPLNNYITNVPGVTVNIIPPVPVLNGVPTNLIGVVGTATWGPVNSPTVIGNMQQQVTTFFPPQAAQYDMGTVVYVGTLNNANNFLCVRVTDGTDTAATGHLVDNQVVPVTGITLTSLYTGTGGNQIFAFISVGSGSTVTTPTYKLTIYMNGGIPEVYDAISGTGNALWQNMVNAVNNGQSPARGKSQLVVATVGTSTNAPLLNTTVQLSGGTDGNSGVTTATLIGSDASSPRTGMYALRGSNASMVVLADGDDPTHYTTQVAFGQQEGAYMIGTIAPGYQDDIAGAIDIKSTAGINSYAFKLMTGDWIEINDPFNNQQRFISPQGFVASILATEAPYLSSLNVPMNGIVATQKTAESRIYSDADLSQLATGNLDVITKPIPASTSSFGVRLGINTSNNLLASTDSYTRMNNYIALTVLAGMGIFIGQPISTTVVNQVQSTISAFLQVLQQAGWIGVLTTNQNTAPPSAFSVTMDTSQANTGTLIANVNVYLWSILSQLVINLNANSGQQGITILPPQLIG